MNDKDFDDLLGLPALEETSLEIIEKDKPEKLNNVTGVRIGNRAAVKELYEKDYKYQDIAKVLKLSEICVQKHILVIRKGNLSDPTTIIKACKALHYQLDENKSLEAVKMVYNHVNADQVQHNQSRGQTVININFDGLNNPSGKKIVSGKAAVYEDAVVIEATD